MPPRVRHAPSVRVSSWEDVADLSASLGVPLDDWQEDVFAASMGERSDGRWASRFVALSTPRQNGKSQLIVARALAGVLLFNEQTIICSAHQTDTAREVFQRLLDVIEDNPSLERRVDSVMKAINREHIRFKGGQTIKIKARSTSGSRGFSCDCLLLDEAQILGAPAWASILPTVSARENPQVWLLGTPPGPLDDGEVFARMRENGISGKDSRLTYLEWSAEVGDDPDAVETWAKANPAYGIRIDREAIESERAAMSPEQFSMERLGRWPDVATRGGALDPDAWKALADPDAERGSMVAFGTDVAEDRSAWIAVAWTREDGATQVMLANDGQPMPPGVLSAESARLTSEWGGAVVPPRAFEDEAEKAGAAVHSLKAGEFTAGCGMVADLLTAGQIRHGNQPALNEAVKAAKWRSAGTGGERAFQLKDFPEVGPLAAVVRAVAGLAAAITEEPAIY